MQVSDGSGRIPVFVPPPNGNSHRSPGYAPGRIVPFRTPPPPKAAPPPPLKPSVVPPPGPVTFNLSEEGQQRERAQSLRRTKNSFICVGVATAAFFLCLIVVLSLTSRDVLDENCPDQDPSLSGWSPGHNPKQAVVVRKGQRLRLDSSATLQSLVIEGLVVFADDSSGSKNLSLRLRHILIEDGGALHIGAPKCRYRSKATITLVGRSNETSTAEVPAFGRKFVGVRGGGTLELHGAKRLSWTLLTRTVPASGLATGGNAFQRNFSRGINLRVVDQDTGAQLHSERFDTHDSHDDSQRLTDLLRSLPPGLIVALAVGDSAVKSLMDETKTTIQSLLGSSFITDLRYRQAWALVSVVGGGNGSCTEDTREHENHDTGGKALARRDFVTVDGVRFSVTAYSEWRNGFPVSGFQVDAVDQVVLNLQDDVGSWQPGDWIVVASTDYSMHQAEEFILLPCPHCTKRQVRIQGEPQFTHVGEVLDGVDMRAEVALLSRNILIHGEMENSCYGNNWCQFFNHDTFGGHIKILGNFSSVHLSHVELKQMGQQVLGSYPVHFHLCGDVDERGGYNPPTYIEALSIHHCFSRCVTVHGTNGLLVRDGGKLKFSIISQSSALLMTAVCLVLRAVSTFWIANPNNNLISNAAAGSQDAGIWYVFHSASTGESHGLVPETRAELTPMGIFYNNRVHSNFKVSQQIPAQSTAVNGWNQWPILGHCIYSKIRFMFRPHENSDPHRPRVAAVIDTLISYKNNDLGAWIRGGDIIIQNSGFADNGVGLSFASDGSYPKDEGSSQEVSESLFVGESRNRGTSGGQNKYWGLGGVDGKNRTLPRNRTFPIRGFQIYDGPVRLKKSTFKNFAPTSERYTSAVGFNLKNTWQLTPRNNLSSLRFMQSVSLKAFFGKPGQWFEENDLDGDKNSIFHDLDGSVSGYPDTYVGRADNFLIQHPSCVNITQWNAVVCSGRYSQVYIQSQGAPSLTLSIHPDEYSNRPLVLRGINSQGAPTQQYQPVLLMSKSYTFHWSGPAPRETVLSLINFDLGDWVLVGLCYPNDSTFQIMSDINDRQNNFYFNIEDYGPLSSLSDLEKRPLDRKYFFDRDSGLLWLYLRARHGRHGHSYCSSRGCERVKITVTTHTKQTCNCTAKTYPKYSKPPTAVLPMPAYISAPWEDCGASKVTLTIIQILTHPLSIVEAERFLLTQTGFLVVTLDACSGKVTKNSFFPKLDSSMEQYLKTGIPKRYRGEGLVFVFGSLAFFGLHGAQSPHPWVTLLSSQGEEVLGLQERFIPRSLEEYTCTQPDLSPRRDLDLLRQAVNQI
uniref:hyaluronoglucosaminidase n=1 Tax=Denticeps clupeoides TaxID=299321 RepID=A0AAY4CSC1_9TELE